MKRLAIGVLCVGLLASALAVTAGEHGKQEEAGLKAARAWLNLIDEGDYGESWNQAAALFQKATTKENWQRALDQVRTPLGNLTSRKVKSVQFTQSLPGAPDGEYVVIQFDTAFEHKKAAVETVTMMMDSGNWKAAGYFIR